MQPLSSIDSFSLQEPCQSNGYFWTVVEDERVERSNELATEVSSKKHSRRVCLVSSLLWLLVHCSFTMGCIPEANNLPYSLKLNQSGTPSDTIFRVALYLPLILKLEWKRRITVIEMIDSFYPSATGWFDWIFFEQLMKRLSLSRKMPGEFIFPMHSNEGKLTLCWEWPTRNNFCVLANNYHSLVNAASNNGSAPSTNAASSLMLMLAFVRVHFGESHFWKVCLDDEGSGEKQKMPNLNLLTPVNSNQELLVAIVSNEL